MAFNIINVVYIDGGHFEGWYSTNDLSQNKGGDYVSFTASRDQGVQEQYRVPRDDYRDYEHFVGVMGKFNPYAFFLRVPVVVPQLDYTDIEMAWLETLEREPLE